MISLLVRIWTLEFIEGMKNNTLFNREEKTHTDRQKKCLLFLLTIMIWEWNWVCPRFLVELNWFRRPVQYQVRYKDYSSFFVQHRGSCVRVCVYVCIFICVCGDAVQRERGEQKREGERRVARLGTDAIHSNSSRNNNLSCLLVRQQMMTTSLVCFWYRTEKKKNGEEKEIFFSRKIQRTL